MKRIKEEMDANQKRMKTLKEKPQEMMEVQRQTMTLNAQYFRHSMIPTLIMLIPLGLLFNWMGGHFGFEPLHPDQTFSATVMLDNSVNEVTVNASEGLDVLGNATLSIEEVKGWFSTQKQAIGEFKGKQGTHTLTFTSGNQSVQKEVLITTGKQYASVQETYKDNVIKSVTLGNQKLNIIWRIGWLGTYLISAIVLISVLRKFLKVY